MSDRPGARPVPVILAAGESSRLWPLGDKSLMRFFGEPLLVRHLRHLREMGLDDAVVVTGDHNGEAIAAALHEGGAAAGVRLVRQTAGRGMAGAVLSAIEVMPGDRPLYVTQAHDVVEPSLHARMLAAHDRSPTSGLLAAKSMDTYFPGGYLVVDPPYGADGEPVAIQGMVEKPSPDAVPEGRLVTIVAHLHPSAGRLAAAIADVRAADGERDDDYERAIDALARATPGAYRCLPYTGVWHALKFPWHTLAIMEHLLRTELRPAAAANVIVEDGARISGDVALGDGVRVLAGADLRGPLSIGPRSLVGQFASVRASMIGAGAVVGVHSEVNRSYIGDGAQLHASRALDSVLADRVGAGRPVNLSAGVITANLRIDGGAVKSTVKGTRVDTGLDKLGAVLGEGAFVSVGAMLMPGVKIGRGSAVGPATVVDEDVPDATRAYVRQDQARTRYAPRDAAERRP